MSDGATRNILNYLGRAAFVFCWLLSAISFSLAQKILIPMDLKQTDHLKAYGIAYWALTKNIRSEERRVGKECRL